MAKLTNEPSIEKAALLLAEAEKKRNGNGTKTRFIATLISIAVAYLAFSSWILYYDHPKTYATKAELHELKSDLKEKYTAQDDNLKYIRDRVDKIFERLP